MIIIFCCQGIKFISKNENEREKRKMGRKGGSNLKRLKKGKKRN